MKRDNLLICQALSILALISTVSIGAQVLPYQHNGLIISQTSRVAQPKPKPTKPRTRKKVTVLVYMAADGNLEPYVDFNRKQMERFGSDNDMNLLLFICTHRVNEQKMSCKAMVHKNKTVILEKIPNLDSGSKSTLLAACRWATGPDFEADEFICILWDHGYGPLNRLPRRGICYDNTTGNFLKDTDLRSTFEIVSRECLHGKKIGLIGFDACLMASIEIARAVQPFAHYMAGSEQTVPALGMPYHMVLDRFNRSSKTAESFGRAMVDGYNAYYGPFTQDYTYSCIDLTKLDPLHEYMGELMAVLTELIKKQKNRSATKALRAAITATPHFQEESFVDLGDWIAQLALRADTIACVDQNDTQRIIPQLKNLLASGKQIINQCLIKSVHGQLFARTCGLFVYLPIKYVDRTYLTTHWSQTTQWSKFLTSLCAS